jgi:hypothetical protein
MNKPAETPKRYKLLMILRENDGMSTKEVAEELEIAESTVWMLVKFLINEDKVIRTGKHMEQIQVTPEGYAWKDPKVVAQDAPKWPCGHPIAASTPDFCLWCRRERKRQVYKQDGGRYIVATMGGRA